MEDKKYQIKCLKDEDVKMKVSFAGHVLSLKQACPSGFAGSSFSSPSVSGPSCASEPVASNNLSGSVLVAKCADALNVPAVEKLLDTPNSGLIPWEGISLEFV